MVEDSLSQESHGSVSQMKSSLQVRRHRFDRLGAWNSAHSLCMGQGVASQLRVHSPRTPNSAHSPKAQRLGSNAPVASTQASPTSRRMAGAKHTRSSAPSTPNKVWQRVLSGHSLSSLQVGRHTFCCHSSGLRMGAVSKAIQAPWAHGELKEHGVAQMPGEGPFTQLASSSHRHCRDAHSLLCPHRCPSSFNTISIGFCSSDV